MAALIILAFYVILIAIFFLLALFIAYHLYSYSLNSEFMIIILAFFTLVSAGLLISNLLLFFSINWNSLISKALAF